MSDTKFFDTEAERALLGYFIQTGAGTEVFRLADPADFHGELERKIVAAMKRLAAKGESVDGSTLFNALRDEEPKVEALRETLSTFVGNFSGGSPLPFQERLFEMRVRRDLEKALRVNLERLHRGGDIQELLYKAQEEVFHVDIEARRKRAHPITELITPAIVRLGELFSGNRDETTGWRNLDRLLGGWSERSISVVSVPPLLDPVLLAIVTGIAAARRKKNVLFLSEQLSKEILTLRMLGIVGRITVPISKFFGDWEALTRAATHLHALPISIVDDLDAHDFLKKRDCMEERPDFLVLLPNSPLRPERIAQFLQAVKTELSCPLVVFASMERPPTRPAWFASVHTWLHVEGVRPGYVRFRIVHDVLGRAGATNVPVRGPLWGALHPDQAE